MRLITLDAFVDANNLCPTLIKVDVEGAELQGLKGTLNTLRHCRPKLPLATHGIEVKISALSCSVADVTGV